MTRGLGTMWVIFLLGLAGTLFPRVFAGDFLDEPRIVRWIAVPLLLVSSFVLADHYLL